MAVTGGIVEASGPVAKRTYTCSAAVTAARLVAFTGNRRVGPAGAGSLVAAGVAMQNASAAEDMVAVAYQGVFRLRAAAGSAIAAGNLVEAAANGEIRQLQTVDAAGSMDPRAAVGRAEEAIAAGADGLVRVTL